MQILYSATKLLRELIEMSTPSDLAKDNELFTAIAGRDGIVRSCRLGKDMRQFDQAIIAGLMTKSIIESLEVVHVDQNETYLVVDRGPFVAHLREFSNDRPAIFHSRERIRIRDFRQ